MLRVALPGPKGESKREGAAETETAAAAAAKARPKRSVRKVNEGKLHNITPPSRPQRALTVRR